MHKPEVHTNWRPTWGNECSYDLEDLAIECNDITFLSIGLPFSNGAVVNKNPLK